jgi:hypothetical protein
MNQGHFFSLLPKDWRERVNYHYIKASYNECLAISNWCSSQTIPEAGTAITALIKLYDPLNSTNLNHTTFFSLLPKSWRERVALA